MHPETQSLLYLISEVAIGTVALSGITMVLLVSDKRISKEQAGQIAAQLTMAFVLVLFSMFPLLLNRFDLVIDNLWKTPEDRKFKPHFSNIAKVPSSRSFGVNVWENSLPMLGGECLNRRWSSSLQAVGLNDENVCHFSDFDNDYSFDLELNKPRSDLSLSEDFSDSFADSWWNQ